MMPHQVLSLFRTSAIEPRDILSFVRAWRADPLRVGAIGPSGSALAQLITREITPGTGPVVELGPGTGVFTRALLSRGVSEQDLTLVECGAEFAVALEQRFPKARLLQIDAAYLDRYVADDGAGAGAVISGLPLLTMSSRKIFSILRTAFRCLRPGAAFYQFTYAHRCPVSRRILDRLGLKATRIGHTLCNVPPAAVYRITRRASRRALA